MDWVKKLEDLMSHLRSDKGCPWDCEQDHKSLKKYLIEETYELIDAIDSEDDEQMISEAGDLLLQIVFHCQIAKEKNRFDLQQVAKRCYEKLFYRHPHVFGDVKIDDPDKVLEQWKELKKKEKEHEKRESILDGIPRGMPALLRAEKTQKIASHVGFDWDDIGGSIEKLEEEVGEIKHEVECGDYEAAKDELGDLLFTCVNLSRFLKEDSEEVLQKATDKFTKRFKKLEKKVAENGRAFGEFSMDELEKIWQSVK